MIALTAKQRGYLDYIRRYIALHGRSPAEHEMQAHFQVTPPSVHRMVVVLEEKGAIRRQAGQARSIEVVADVARRVAGQSVQTIVPEDFYEKTPSAFFGRWRIIETDVWSRDALDEAVPANITFQERAQGHFQMIHVEGGLDCRFSHDRVEFSWSGVDGRRQKSGRGWAELQPDGALPGRIYFPMGRRFLLHGLPRSRATCTPTRPRAGLPSWAASMIDAHRRILAKDLQAYRERVREAREDALFALTEEAEALGLGD